MFVTERFELDPAWSAALHNRKPNWGFGAFSEVIYYRTYSRIKANGEQETWADTVIRVTEGIMSIRKDWYKKMHRHWNESYWQEFAKRLSSAIFEMKMLPPGRGLHSMGTDYVYERGSASLFNCGFVDVKTDLADAAAWAMDMLMLGVGIGVGTANATFSAKVPDSESDYVVADSREGWVDSVRRLIESYTLGGAKPHFDYSHVRPAGAALKSFGGIASGPGPLIKAHERIDAALRDFAAFKISKTRVIADVFNAIGACVVSGNIRRSAELLTGSIGDKDFLNLKNYSMYPERAEIGWMSNNSIVLSNSDEFELLPEIAERVADNGEPGIINLINVQKYGRVGKHKADRAVGMNPCAEIPLEDRELCNLAETFPTRCDSVGDFWDTLALATFYASTVSLLPTHEPTTNEVIMRNRRIGVSVSGIADWVDNTNLSHVTMALRKGYEHYVEPINQALATEAGVPPSIRLTTVKPSGTISLLAGVSAGMHWPVARYAIRRVRIADSSPLVPILEASGIHGEEDDYSDNTLVYSFPIAAGNGRTRSVKEVSIWEQASLVAMLQREWADNSVSNTLTFKASERGDIEHVLAAYAPLTKSMSILPLQEEAENAYTQPPYEPIDAAQYQELVASSKSIDWALLRGYDGIDPKFCANDACEI